MAINLRDQAEVLRWNVPAGAAGRCSRGLPFKSATAGSAPNPTLGLGTVQQGSHGVVLKDGFQKLRPSTPSLIERIITIDLD